MAYLVAGLIGLIVASFTQFQGVASGLGMATTAILYYLLSKGETK
jgi:hypothetical protein